VVVSSRMKRGLTILDPCNSVRPWTSGMFSPLTLAIPSIICPIRCNINCKRDQTGTLSMLGSNSLISETKWVKLQLLPLKSIRLELNHKRKNELLLKKKFNLNRKLQVNCMRPISTDFKNKDRIWLLNWSRLVLR
jgi:hypothetical protein